MTKTPSILGGACIIASVCVGAGMLALPTSGAGAWTIYSALILLLTMICMTLSGSLLLESYQGYDSRISFHSVTKDLLGNFANIISNLSVYFVGAILLYAYINVSGIIFSGLFQEIFKESAFLANLGADSFLLKASTWSIIALIVFSSFVLHSTRAVDRISIVLIAFMVISFLLTISGLVQKIEVTKLFDTQNQNGEYLKYSMIFLPAALTSFGYHHSVSTMRAYYGEERKAQKAITYGTFLALILYLLWIFAIFGNFPRQEFEPIIKADGDVDALLVALNSVIDSSSVEKALRIFSIAAVLSSFIGVGLGVFDYLADLFKFKNNALGRSKTWLVTFLPPLYFALSYPFGFVQAIAYAGAVATIWTCLLPVLLVHKKRKTSMSLRYKTPGGNFTLILVFVFGVAVATFHLLNVFGKLPVFTG